MAMAMAMGSVAAASSISTCGNLAKSAAGHSQVESPLGTLRFSRAQQYTRLRQSRRRNFAVSAEYSRRSGGGAGDFVAGFLLGGVVFGALGYLLAPQVNRSVSDVKSENGALPKDSQLDDEGIEKTRRSLSAKIDELNAAIENVSSQLRNESGAAKNGIEVSV